MQLHPRPSVHNAAGPIEKAGLQPLNTMQPVQQRHKGPSLCFIVQEETWL